MVCCGTRRDHAGRWLPMAALPVPLAFFGAVPLRAGGILVVGGLSGIEMPVTAEAFRHVPTGGPTDRP